MKFKGAITALLCTVSGSGLAADAVTICWENELKPPYLELNQSGAPAGIMVERLEQSLSQAGLAWRHKLRPWKQCLKDIEAGRVDLVPNASYKPAREVFAHYSKPAYASELVLYYSTKRFPEPPVVADADTLGQYKVAGLAGFNYSFYDGKVDVEQKLRKRRTVLSRVKGQNVDFAVLQKGVVEDLIAKGKLNTRGLRYIPDPVKPKKEYHVLVSRQSPRAEALLEVINQGL